MPSRSSAVLALVATAAAFSALAGGKDGPPDRSWSVAQVGLATGGKLIVRFRSAAPAGVNRAELASRCAVRCAHPDGQTPGFPDKERLQLLQRLESELQSPSAILMMAKLGDGAREMIFQVSDRAEFLKLASAKAKGLALSCSVEAQDDPTWSLWESTVTKLSSAK